VRGNVISHEIHVPKATTNKEPSKKNESVMISRPITCFGYYTLIFVEHKEAN
jgi:hypothetical protein